MNFTSYKAASKDLCLLKMRRPYSLLATVDCLHAFKNMCNYLLHPCAGPLTIFALAYQPQLIKAIQSFVF